MKKLDDLEEVSDLGFHSSPISSMEHDQSPTHSGSSFAYGRTNSETSGFSEHLTDDFNSCSSEANSPKNWPATGRSPYRPTLSRFGGMKRNHMLENDDKVNDQKPTDLGEFSLQFSYFTFDCYKIFIKNDANMKEKGECQCNTTVVFYILDSKNFL